ncbi:hypothetical protein ACLI4U_08930 [Natrialbaceae archaeon A-CW2]
MSDSLLPVSLDLDEPDTWEDAICVECDADGALEVDVELVGTDGVRLVTVTMGIDCIDQIPDRC